MKWADFLKWKGEIRGPTLSDSSTGRTHILPVEAAAPAGRHVPVSLEDLLQQVNPMQGVEKWGRAEREGGRVGGSGLGWAKFGGQIRPALFQSLICLHRSTQTCTSDVTGTGQSIP